jgi:thiamine-monophosphate kinase
MLIEHTFLNKIKPFFDKSNDQINGLLESDAELIHLTENTILAITTDTIVEEIEIGLYDDPYHIGWMVVTVNFSDLAAVGAEPRGFLLNLQITKMTSQSYMEALLKGINAACREYGTSVVGGDTNFSRNLQLGGTSFGIIQNGKPIMRIGCHPGDQLYISGEMGLGSVYALEKLIHKNESRYTFFPRARLNDGKIIRQFGSCCIDTSDGFFAALSNLMYINKFGILLHKDLDELIPSEYRKSMENLHLPPWFILAGRHGEFELLFTVDKQKEESLLNEASKNKWNPIKIGEIIEDPILKFQLHDVDIQCDPDDITNIYEKSEGDLNNYIERLIQIHKSWQPS